MLDSVTRSVGLDYASHAKLIEWNSDIQGGPNLIWLDWVIVIMKILIMKQDMGSTSTSG